MPNTDCLWKRRLIWDHNFVGSHSNTGQTPQEGSFTHLSCEAGGWPWKSMYREKIAWPGGNQRNWIVHAVFVYIATCFRATMN